MQGYIINYNKTRDEDLIVTLLTKEKLKTLYRFYGARHSTIQLGYKVDFEAEYSPKAHFKRMRNILHLHYDYIFSHDKMYAWQSFLKLLHGHLRDVEHVDSFYFDLLEELSLKLSKSAPKRVLIEGFIKMLEHEGRLHGTGSCYFCSTDIEENRLALVRAFLPAHTSCVFAKELDRQKVDWLYANKSSSLLEDEEIEVLWETLSLGF